ncbi:MAG: hypothetical protein WB626_06275 [Bacteroidota bacterium]
MATLLPFEALLLDPGRIPPGEYAGPPPGRNDGRSGGALPEGIPPPAACVLLPPPGGSFDACASALRDARTEGVFPRDGTPACDVVSPDVLEDRLA